MYEGEGGRRGGMSDDKKQRVDDRTTPAVFFLEIAHQRDTTRPNSGTGEKLTTRSRQVAQENTRRERKNRPNKGTRKEKQQRNVGGGGSNAAFFFSYFTRPFGLLVSFCCVLFFLLSVFE